MTIKQRENVIIFSGQKKVTVFNEKNGKLSETAEAESLQVSNLQQKLWKTLREAASYQEQVGKHSQYVEQSTQDRKLEGKGNYPSEERQSTKGPVNEESNPGGRNDHLLILANSAELMLESDSLDGTLENEQNHEDHKSPGKQFEGTLVIDHLRNDGDGFNCTGRTPRLSQIRCQARLKSNLLLKQTLGEPTVGHLQGGRIRLTQIRHQARSKSHSQRYSCGAVQGGIMRLSELRRQARSKYNSSMQEAIEDHVPGHLDCQTYKDNQRKRVIEDIFGEEDGSKAASGFGFHPSKVDTVHEYIASGGGDLSLPANNEVLDKIVSVRGRIRLSHLKCKARLGNASTLDRGDYA
ncbi:uncharacterized protein LOC110616255 isoform X2 [Manihot esculenta]|uniref:Uncharacterized protein n=5 Tax=Manihot esculenta TaxID=3983 RepID=A0ACB7HNK1_MANES|nr:uncharacterized protein LOC110616255 isoform X2 [Manihot esculenta]KAG8654109.1 hypothetical protein MANES_05G102600v8 [Manihot esculenta]KAG8654111.1 hypothetical protein MANES_05G102600v8 [Manihot esculenta]KAG8654114.1 hypothetical protein MANES_05G102600v8 [Manihot esculenta]KAG8654115.1 hypothetical protein MANES_05G102600v8 [Manihot esculenta]OAY50025.1 hypothetical protein MANES_05G102600v8 [Manihot esculenta]